MKTAISIPDKVFTAADRLAKRLALSRSELYARAVAEFIEQHKTLGVAEQLDRVYGEQPAGPAVDSVLEQMQQHSVGKDEW